MQDHLAIDTNSLFSPLRLKSLQLKNRFVMAPMTRSFSPGGVPPSAVASYYQRRAQGEVGLIISEGTAIDRPSSSNNPNVPRFYGEEALNAWGQVAHAVHESGGIIAPQLWHMGVVPNAASGWVPDTAFEGPSSYYAEGEQNGIAMDEKAIQQTIEAYAKAAKNSQQLGFDAVEIHGAHGYLIDQFFWEVTNNRADIYGGHTLAERTRFGVEVVKAIRQAVGDNFVIILRLSQWKVKDYTARMAKTPQELETWLTPLAEAGVDIFHCSQRRFWQPEFIGSPLNFAGWTKKITGKATITVGSVGLAEEFLPSHRNGSIKARSIEDLVTRFERGEFDLVAVGRALLADPNWVVKVKEGRLSEFRGYSHEHLQQLI